jgi:hypothetical protein
LSGIRTAGGIKLGSRGDESRYSLYLQIYMNYIILNEGSHSRTNGIDAPVYENIPTLSLRRICIGRSVDKDQDEKGHRERYLSLGMIL